MGRAGGEFDDLDAADHRAAGIAQYLAMFHRHQVGEFLQMAVEDFLEAEQYARTTQRRGVTPARKGLGRNGDGPRCFSL